MSEENKDFETATENAVNTENNNQELYLVLGETALDLMSGQMQGTQLILDKLLGYNRFAILRPSMAEQ